MATGKLIIITAPSGSGKTSITKYLLDKYPRLSFSVSATTRKPRQGEKDGVDYYFISAEDFQQKISEDAFIEWEMVYEGKYYGTLKSELERIWSDGRVPVLDIDVQGAIHVEKQFPGTCLSIFIQPPSIEELKRRLEKRQTESLESLQTRLSKANYELSFTGHFNRVIINDNLEKACHETEEVITSFLGWN
ncbi:MAG TPA: guanylate kinase [Chitinophagaceae bacterium]|nr:guanylate kinase [Chitinophagaceae bacterium]